MSVIDDSGNLKHQTCGPGRARATRESLSRENEHGENNNNREKNVNSFILPKEKSPGFTTSKTFLNIFLTFVGQTWDQIRETADIRIGDLPGGSDDMIVTSRNKNNRMAHLSEAAEVGLDAVWWPAPQPEHAAQLARFESIDLEQMAGATLLDRVETKYVFHEQNLDAILGALLDSYRILEVNGNRLNHYRTLYYDTSDFALYHRHHAGGRNRYKVRGRSYLDSDTSFLEIKRKVKENRTIKSRVRTTGLAEQLTPPMNGFLQAHLPPGSLHLEPKLWNEYTRVTLVGLGEPERVTLDLNLRVRAGDRTIIWPGVVVAEVKAGDHDHDSVFKQLMKARGTRFTSFSKYCIGVSMLYPEIKHNRFKPKLRMISQLIQKEGNYVN